MAPSANSPIAPPPSSIPRLAARGEAEAAKVTPFWATFDRMLSDAYCARDNPVRVCGVAESLGTAAWAWLQLTQCLTRAASSTSALPTTA
jgi:hypothetical protein